MTNPSEAPTFADQTINEAARYMRVYRTFGPEWNVNGVLLLFAGIASPIIINQMLPERQLEYYIGILVFLPLLLIGVRLKVESIRRKRLDSQFCDIFRADYSELRRNVSSSAIASLLDVITGPRDDNLLPTLMALLNDLLKSLKAEDTVVLTNDQRSVLHELVIQGRQDAIPPRSAAELGESERRSLRPSIIGALALLGNASSIPVLERFAETTVDSDLRQTALHSVEQIRERLQYGPEEMLRASRAPERPDTLLRAALPDKPHDHDPQELLRPDNAAEFQNTSALQQVHEPTMSVSTRARD